MRSVAPWIVLLSLLTLVSFAACGPGEGGDDGGVIGACEEMCDGDTAVTCDDDDNETRTDCTEDFSSCLEIDGAVGCAAAVGESCLVDGVLSLCEGEEAGCIDDGEAICEENVGTCAESDARSCEGEVFISDCEGGQPYRIDCEAPGYDGICEDGTGCIVPAGSFCDDFDFFCEDGLTCNDSFECE